MSAPAKSGRTVPGCMGTKKQYACAFPGCTGGCHVCGAVEQQRANAPLYAAALRALRAPLSDDARAVVEWAAEMLAPTFDERRGRWIDQRRAGQ